MFNELLGKTINEIKGLKKDNDEVYFECSDGTKYKMYHEQDCCEMVYIEDVCGDVEDVIGSTITMAEEVSNSDDVPLHEYDESYTWTYYKLATIKGYLTIKWYSVSNGYYLEKVYFKRIN